MLNKYINIIKKLYNKYEEVIKYLIFGGLTTLVSILSYSLFTRLFSINYLISNILSWILSVLFAFITNKIYVFKSKTKDKNEVIDEIIDFIFFRLLSLCIESIILYTFVSILQFNDLVMKLVAQIVVIILNYVFSKLFVFKKDL